jgi:ribosome-associated translation inhibitor RaiA
MTRTPTTVISFKDMPVHEETRETLEAACGRLGEEFPEVTRIEVAVSADGAGHAAHGHVTGRETDVAAQAQAMEPRQAAQRLIDALERQLRKGHDKRIFLARREAQRENQRKRS